MTAASGDGWRAVAGCTDLGPSLFYDPATASIARAKAICARCPARCDCAAKAVEAGEFGVWGGLTEEERLQLVPGRRGPKPALADADLTRLFRRADPTLRALVVLTRSRDLGPRSAYVYLARARELGLVERREGRLYPVSR